MSAFFRGCCSSAATPIALPASRAGPRLRGGAVPVSRFFWAAGAPRPRPAVLERAIAAGKHVYCEKPVAPTAAQAHALLRQAQRRGRKNGGVGGKLTLAGLQKLAPLTSRGGLGRIVSFRLEFGWWVFDGSEQ